MITVKTKALSCNRAWRGRRFKTPEYTAYERELYYLLPKTIIPKGKLKVLFKFGTSSKNSDLDNFLKTTIDIMQKKYKFNDKMIYRLEVEKVDVKKGEEFIKFEIKTCPTSY